MGKKILQSAVEKLPRAVKPFETKEKIILRDWLALQRTTLANERTLFAYIRTSLYLIIGGFALLQIKRLAHLEWLAYAAFLISVFCLFHGTLRYILLRRKLRKHYDSIESDSL